MNYFEQLNQIDCSEMTEKKGGLTYLSWPHAWKELKKLFPKSYYTVYQNELEWNYFTDNRYCWVKTGVTVVTEDGEAIEHIEYLPVMDYKNISIPLDKVTSFDVNKTIQRSLTKAVARHGLGLYIYAGEDLPDKADGSVEERASHSSRAKTKEKAKSKLSREDLEVKIVALCDAKRLDIADICKRVKVGSLEELTDDRLEKCLEYVQGL
jgi:hypothetical protein|nr:MAG TPA: Protein of unknown function (DUF1071) [Caudoviricetes sp.]